MIGAVAAGAAAAALVLRDLLVALLPPLFFCAAAAAAVLPHFLTAAAGIFASPLLDIAAGALLSDPETVPPLALRTLCCPAWSGPYLVLLRRQSHQHASHCLFCHLSTSVNLYQLSYSAEVQPSDIEMGPL